MLPIRLRARILVAALATALLAACGGGSEPTPPADNPTPDIVAITPGSVIRGSPATEVTVTGSDFVATSVVRVNGADRATRFVSRTEVKATLLASDLLLNGSLQVQVTNPPPGGGTSGVVLLDLVQPVTPAPTVTAVSPSFVNAGSPPATVMITGTGFGATSFVRVDAQAPGGAVVVSETTLQVTLTAAQLATPGSRTITIVNPAPGGGLASAVVEVRAPAPTLSALSIVQSTAGQSQLLLRVTGTGFFAGSAVRVNEAPRPTTYVNATTLDVVIPAGDLSEAGPLAISVANPAPGGGTSAALTLQLVNGAPVLVELPSRGASAGSGGFSLTVHGRGFVRTSTVRWNGADRPTQYVSGTRLVADIAPSDVASPGTAQVTVATPAPGGGTSAPQSIAVRSVGAASITTLGRTAFQASDLAVDDARALLYLSIRSNAASEANNVIAIDPATGAIAKRVFAGSGPARLARSDDGQYLYVGLNGANAVRRIILSTFGGSLQWSLPAGQVAGEMVVLPGRAGSVVVSRQTPGYSPPLAGVTVYDDGVARLTSSPGHTGGNRIAVLSSPDTVYGFNNAHTGFEFFTIVLDAAGARHATTNGGLVGGFYTNITGAAGRIYGTDGSVVDAARLVKAGSFPGSSISMTVDATLGRAFALTGNGVSVYDINTFQLLGTVAVPTLGFDHPAAPTPRIARWGADGIAFLDMDELIVVRSPLFGP